MAQNPPHVIQIQSQFQPMVNYGPESLRCVCPHCHAQIKTNIKTRASTNTCLFTICLYFFCCCCMCLPCCCGCCKKKNHYCPNCKQYLGTYES